MVERQPRAGVDQFCLTARKCSAGHSALSGAVCNACCVLSTVPVEIETGSEHPLLRLLREIFSVKRFSFTPARLTSPQHRVIGQVATATAILAYFPGEFTRTKPFATFKNLLTEGSLDDSWASEPLGSEYGTFLASMLACGSYVRC